MIKQPSFAYELIFLWLNTSREYILKTNQHCSSQGYSIHPSSQEHHRDSWQQVFPNVQNCILAAWPACLLVLLTLDMDFDTLTSTQQYLEVHSAWREDRRVGPMQSRPNEYECLNLDEVDKDNGSICLSLPIDTSLCQYHEYVVLCYKFIPRTRLVEW
jgi:hypothetical protein